jgi:hypothetical protein
MNRSQMKQQMEERFLVAVLFVLAIGTVMAYVLRR